MLVGKEEGREEKRERREEKEAHLASEIVHFARYFDRGH